MTDTQHGATVPQLSPDGLWEWNGTQWIPAQPAPDAQQIAQSVPIASAAAPTQPASPAQTNPVSPDGKHQWNGTAWVPLQKNGHLLRNLGIVVGALLLFGIVIAVASSGSNRSTNTASSSPAAAATAKATSAPSAPAPAKTSTYNLAVGQAVDMTNTSSGDAWNVTVNSIKAFTSDNQFETPTAGYHFIVIDVTYAVTNGTADANPLDWEAKDATGSVSPLAFSNETLPAGSVEAPNKVRGTVVLEIANGSGGTVVYSAGFSERASWSFSAADVA